MAQSVAMVTVDGVLRKHDSVSPLPEGIALYQALTQQYVVVLAVEDKTDEQFELNEQWLEDHGLMEHTAFLCWLAYEGRVAQANSLRRQGYAVDLVVDPDPGNVSQLYEAGFTSLLFLHPSYARPEHRPDHRADIPSWSLLSGSVEKDASLRAGDNRTDYANDTLE